MISIKFNRKGIQKAKRQIPKEIATQVGSDIETIAHIIHERVHANTPVFEGRAVANYQWRQDAPFKGIIEPVGDMPPGRTSRMSLGEEPRRGPNRALSDASLMKINFKKLKKLFLTNNVPYFAELEYGRAGDKEIHRTPPTGIFRAALAEVKAYLMTKKGTMRIIVKE